MDFAVREYILLLKVYEELGSTETEKMVTRIDNETSMSFEKEGMMTEVADHISLLHLFILDILYRLDVRI